MILIYAVIVLAIAAAIYRRGDLSSFTRLPFKYSWSLVAVLILLAGLQAGLVIYVGLKNTILQPIFLVLTQAALILLLWLNRHIAGVKLFIIGVAMNTLVIVANGGWMPITPERYEWNHQTEQAVLYSKPASSKNIILPREETRLWILSDIIPIGLWRRWAISPGDALLVVAVGQFLFQAKAQKEVDIKFRAEVTEGL